MTAFDAALAHWPLGEHRLVPLAESFNTVFRVDTPSARFVLRVGPEHRLHPAGSAALEDRWTRELAVQGLPVPRIVPPATGRRPWTWCSTAGPGSTNAPY